MNKKYQIIYPEEIPSLIKDAEWIAIDTETTGLSMKDDNVLYLTFTTQEDNGYLVKVDKFYTEAAQLLTCMTAKKVFHYRYFDEYMLRKMGYAIHRVEFDTKVARYVSNSTAKNGLKFLAKKYLKEEPKGFKEVIPRGKTMADMDMQDILEYACDDSNNTFRLREPLTKRLQKDEASCKLYKDLELPISKILGEMLWNGMKVHPETLEKAKRICTKHIDSTKEQIAEYIGEHVNLNSPKQLAECLYEHLDLPVCGLTDTGNFSTDVGTLEALKNDHPVIPLLQDYKEHSKLLSTYIDPMLSMIDSAGFIHGQLNQCVTTTGRLSSSEPNLQNMPVKSKTGKLIRKSFVSRFPGGKLIVADQSQFELRLLAHMANEPLMIKAFKKKGVDYHQIKADEMDISRSDGKTLNFAIVYNVGYEKLSTNLKKSEAVAAEYLRKQEQTYKAVAKWKKVQIAFGKKEGYVRTILGRRCYITHKKYVGTTAVNYPIQGSAADLLKLAMIKIAGHIDRMGFKAKMVNQVHDELVIDCPENEIKLLAPYVKEIFEHPKWGEEYIKLRCPLEADIKIVDNWGEAKE